MTTDDLDALLRTARPAEGARQNPATGKVEPDFYWAHENSYSDGDDQKPDFLPDVVFQKLPGVEPGPRHPSSGLLAGAPPGHPRQLSYVASYPTREEAVAALATAAHQVRTEILLNELAAPGCTATLPADFSRADIYNAMPAPDPKLPPAAYAAAAQVWLTTADPRGLRELDVGIHRGLFGFSDIRVLPTVESHDGGELIFSPGDPFVPPDAVPEYCYLPAYTHDGTCDTLCRVVPRYATSIADAWAVAEFDGVFRGTRVVVHTTLMRYRDGVYGPWWCALGAVVGPRSYHKPVVWARGEHAEEALARAAVLLVDELPKAWPDAFPGGL